MFPLCTAVIFMGLFASETVSFATELTVDLALQLNYLFLVYLLTIWAYTMDIFIRSCIYIFRNLNVQNWLKFVLTQDFRNIVDIKRHSTRFILLLIVIATCQQLRIGEFILSNDWRKTVITERMPAVKQTIWSQHNIATNLTCSLILLNLYVLNSVFYLTKSIDICSNRYQSFCKNYLVHQYFMETAILVIFINLL